MNSINEPIYRDICTPAYYERCIQTIKENNPDTVFYIFSDDKKYIRSKIQNWPGIVLVDDGLSDLEEFYCMALCHHHILANSTFSWWAAWMNRQKGALHLAPDKWLNTQDYSMIYSDWMTKIPVE